MENNIKVGDVVRLNSCPDVLMTVVKDHVYGWKDHRIKCEWFDTHRHLHTSVFLIDCVTRTKVIIEMNHGFVDEVFDHRNI